MRTQIWIIGAAFAIFGALAWIFTFFSVAYLGLMGIGLVAFVIGLRSGK